MFLCVLAIVELPALIRNVFITVLCHAKIELWIC